MKGGDEQLYLPQASEYKSSPEGAPVLLLWSLKVNFLESDEEEMKKLILTLLICLAALMGVTPAFASELWDPHLYGTDEGLAAGALPPPGFYFINNTWMLPEGRAYGPLYGAPDFKKSRDSLGGAFVDVPILTWVPGCKFLGADYGAAIAQPFDYGDLRVSTGTVNIGGKTYDSFIGGQQWGTFNTILVPYSLSWKLPCDFRVKTSFSVALNDATSSPGNAAGPRGPFAQSGNGTYMFQPSVGISWLHAGWNLSGEFYYGIQTKNTTTDYQSGDTFAADYTLTYTYGKWTFGVGAAEENQLFNDTHHGVTVPDSKATVYCAGPIVGYNFGSCSIMFIYNFGISANNDIGNDMVNVRLVVPLGKLF